MLTQGRGRRSRAGGVVVDGDDRSVGEADVRDAAAANPHHHGLDDAEAEQRRDGGVDGIAPDRHHLDAGGGGDGVVGADHTLGTDGRDLEEPSGLSQCGC